MIAIVNYGSGNIQALGNIYDKLNIPFIIASHPEDLEKAEKIILPGVGAFDQAIGELERSGMKQSLDEHVLQQKKPVLGICVGMQLLAKNSEEGVLTGLSWINATVKKFDHASFHQATHLPHMGWNNVEPAKPNGLFTDVDLTSGYYFLHSFYFSCNDDQDILSVTDYGNKFTSAVNRENIYGVQFHPEKSHLAGIQLLKNFANFK
ncbi:MAG: imidazole glycerol phosphate synthase subunit HisH [Bacteroidota bacterium]